MGSNALPPLRSRLAVSLGRGLAFLFIAMGLTVGITSLVVIGPFHRTMRFTDESLENAEGLARRVQSGVESSSGIIGGVTSSLNATAAALDEMVILLRQTSSTLERIRGILPSLGDDLRNMARTAGSLLPGNRLRETSEKMHALHDDTENLEEEIVVLSFRVVVVRESLDSLTADVTGLEEDVRELEVSLSRANESLSRLAGSFSPSGVTAVFLWGSLLLASLMILTGVFLLLKLDMADYAEERPRAVRNPRTGTRRPGKGNRK